MSEAAQPTVTGSRPATMEKIVNLCKRRGIVFPTSDIYGGLGSTFDYGPLGVELRIDRANSFLEIHASFIEISKVRGAECQ